MMKKPIKNTAPYLKCEASIQSFCKAHQTGMLLMVPNIIAINTELLSRWAKAWSLILAEKGWDQTSRRCFLAHSAPPLVQRYCWLLMALITGGSSAGDSISGL